MVSQKKIIIFLIFSVLSYFQVFSQNKIGYVGSGKNDLFHLIKENGLDIAYFNDLTSAIKELNANSGIIITADNYPVERVSIKDRDIAFAAEKKIKLFIEYPDSLRGVHLSDTLIKNRLFRGIVNSDTFGNKLEELSLLSLNDCALIPAKVDSPLILLGKVAGFKNAVFGLKETPTYPVLFKSNHNLIALTKISDFATGRFGPSKSWRTIWEHILSYLSGEEDVQLEYWPSYVTPSYDENEKLPKSSRINSIKNGVDWFFKANLFVDPIWKSTQSKFQNDGISPYGPPVENLPNGDGSLGILEGPTSIINFDGSQEYRYWLRADVQGEVAFALSSAKPLLNDKKYFKIAKNLLNFVFLNSDLRSGEKSDKDSPLYGLIGWAVTHPDVFYGDDNARFILGAIGTSVNMKSNEWDSLIVENILANYRTTNKKGFRGNRLSGQEIRKNGWEYYYNSDSIVSPHPHFESWLWACYLWLYDKTGYKPLLDRTERAIKLTMEKYPKDWLWTNGLQQERARMILPLSWLVKVNNSKLHRRWLKQVVEDLISFQDENGAIREELGTKGKGQAGPAISNADYGTHEEPLIFSDGQKVSDMLYTSNFALFSLNEAAKVMNDKDWQKAVEKLSQFLIRIQVESKKFEHIDGAWFRAFDYGDWEYWASNGDNGWGAWTTLSGWIQSWIVSTQVLIEKNTSYWDLTKDFGEKEIMRKEIFKMLGEK